MVNELKEHKKILIVEDDDSLRNILRDKLSLEGFGILEAKDGQEGLMSALRDHPNLILLDIVMPTMDGITMMTQLREKNEWGKNVPIILLTNLTGDDDKINQAIADNEPAYYLVKSNWALTDLIEKIKERLSR